MEVEFTQNIYYSNKRRIPIKNVANALLALEENGFLTSRILERLYRDVSIESLNVFVDTLETGSLKEKIKYHLFLAFQKQITEFTGVELKTLENESEKKKSQILGWLVAALIVIGLKVAADRAFPNQQQPNIENQINITLATGEKLTGIEASVLAEVIGMVLDENPNTIKNTIEIAKPAKLEAGSSLELDSGVILSPDFLAEVPSSVINDEDIERSIELTDTEIYIRATDKDSSKKGWGATIPEFTDKRLRMHISPGVDLEFIAHLDVIIGNVSIFYQLDEQGVVRKSHAHLHNVNTTRTLELGE